MNVTINILVSTILYFIYGIAFTVLFIVLLVRVVVLWFAIALSPVLALQFVFPDAAKSITGEFDIKDIFIKHAFAPVIIGFGMTIGYLMLDAFKQTTTPSLSSSLQLGADFANAFSVGTGGIQELMIGLAAAAIVWKVTFTAAEGTLAQGITNGIRSTVGGFAKRVASLPKYMQWIPVPANLDNDGTANGKVSLPSVLATFDSKLREVETRGATPIGGFKKENILAHAKDASIGNASNDTWILQTLNTEPEVRNALTIKSMKAIIDRNPTLSQHKEAFTKLIKDSNLQYYDTYNKFHDKVKDNQEYKAILADIKVRNGEKTMAELIANPNAGPTPTAPPPADKPAQPKPGPTAAGSGSGAGAGSGAQ
jgi:hypothetical protein